MPYLRKVKELSSSFPTLIDLAEWMDSGGWGWGPYLGTTKWEERCNRTNVTLLEYVDGQHPTETSVTAAKDLNNLLEATALSSTPEATSSPPLRVYIVEDLSQQVIELLGSRFAIDPLFFREQVGDLDYCTSPIPPVPSVGSKHRQWLSLRHVRLRQFGLHNSPPLTSPGAWNVTRTLRLSHENVSIIETNTAIWLGKDKRCHDTFVCIVLVDPPMNQGSPLWNDRTNWLSMPDLDTIPSPLPFKHSDSLYRDIVQFSIAYPLSKSLNSTALRGRQGFVNPAIYTICSDWLLLCRYIKKGLVDIEDILLQHKDDGSIRWIFNHYIPYIDTWHHQIHIFREMVLETLDQALPAASTLSTPLVPYPVGDALADTIPDFKHILRTLDELQGRIDRIADRITAKMQYEAARESLNESHNLARLTWLAAIFVPLSFVSSLFSMADDVSAMKGTFKTYFAAAIPVTIMSLLVARWGSSLLKGLVDGVLKLLDYCDGLKRNW
jgi:hypothetical protein